MADELAGRVELEHRRRGDTAVVRGLWIRRRADLGARGHRVVAAVDHPDVILASTATPVTEPKQPVIGQRLRPQRIHLDGRGGLKRGRGGHERGQECERRGADSDESVHCLLRGASPRGPPPRALAGTPAPLRARGSLAALVRHLAAARDGRSILRAVQWKDLLRSAAVALLVLVPGRAVAHEIPASVVVQAFVRPQGDTLRLAVRVPLAAMRDVEFPLTPTGCWMSPPATGCCAMPRCSGWRARSRSTKRTSGSACRAWPPSACHCPRIASFVSFEGAVAHLTGPPLAADTAMIWNQALFDVLLDYPIASDRHTFSVRPALARLGVRVVTVLRYQPPAGAERAFEYSGDPGLLRLDPRWHQAAWRFVRLGFGHILDGIDHLLFLFCLVIPFRRFGALVLIVTAFTIAHSMTLIAAASGLVPDALWFSPLVETVIAASILYMALENIVGFDQRPAPLDDCLRLRARPRLRVLVRAARNPAVRRLPSPDLAAGVQCRGRGRAAVRARVARTGTAAAVSLRRGRACRHGHPVGARRAYGVALDGRTLGATPPIRSSVARAPDGGRRHSLDHARSWRRGDRVADRRRHSEKERRPCGRLPAEPGSAQENSKPV